MKEGIEKEFLSMLERHISILVKIVNVYTHTADDRKDLMSDIVYELWKSYPRFRGEAQASTWLYRVALNIALKSKRKRDNNKLLFVDELIRFDDGVWENPSGTQEFIQTLYQCIEELTPINKAIILLYLDDKSNEEIADITGLSRTNVSTRLNRIREQLKTCMIRKDEYGIR